jgi:signal transduction histidine kinase
MTESWSIARRLTVAYGGALFFTLLAFALVGMGIVQYSERAQYESDLLQVARKVDGLSSWHDGAFHPREIDDVRIARINSTLAESAIFRPGGGVVYSSSPAMPAFVQGLARTLPAHDTAGRFQTANAHWLAAIVPIVYEGTARGTVVTWHNEASWMGLEQRLSTFILYCTPVFAVIALLFGAAIARAGLRPLHAIAGVVSEIETRDLSRRIPLRGMPRELERFASAFNNLLDRLEAAFTRERQFTADASHELRAPLTVIRATAEYALQTYRDGTEYRRALQTIGFEAQDLEALIRDLLAAARNESLAATTPARADFAATAFDVMEELYPIARSRGISVMPDLPPELIVAIDAQSATRLIRVLLDNALRHASHSVRIAVRREGTSAVLIVTDDGDGFSDEALRHATERFWRDDASRQRGEGTGLGLSIALGVAHAAGGSISLGNAAPRGAEVRITLPLASA